MNENLVSPREQYSALKEFFNDFMEANQDLIWELACITLHHVGGLVRVMRT